MELKVLLLFLFVIVNVSALNVAQSGEYDKISSVISNMSKRPWITCLEVFVGRNSLMIFYPRKYFKRRITYSSGHPGSFNPAVITNKEAHIIYGNMNNEGEAGSSRTATIGRKRTTKISDYFSKNEQNRVLNSVPLTG